MTQETIDNLKDQQFLRNLRLKAEAEAAASTPAPAPVEENLLAEEEKVAETTPIAPAEGTQAPAETN